jgi:NAD(P)-dependent dehydrogenase (short-subunit alcohol dehydrogenase family)
MTDEDWYKVLAVNLSGAFFMSRAALEHMIERGTGRIINISSIIGQTGNIGQTNYAASKSGLFGLTTSLAKEAAFALKKADKLDGNDVGLTVNTVAPGFIETEMLETVPEKVLDRIRVQGPAGALGAPRTRSRARTSWPPTPRVASPGRSGPSTADRTCRRAMGDDDIRALATDAFAASTQSESRDAFFDAYDPTWPCTATPAPCRGSTACARSTRRYGKRFPTPA